MRQLCLHGQHKRNGQSYGKSAAFVVRTNVPMDIQKELGDIGSADVYPSSEAWQRFYMFDPFEEMDIPREDGYYIADIICPAPFGDNIMGH